MYVFYKKVSSILLQHFGWTGPSLQSAKVYFEKSEKSDMNTS